MTAFLIKKAQIVDSGKIITSDLLIKNGFIDKISPSIDNLKFKNTEIVADDKILIPGVIDVHVHFREPGLAHKADIYTESRAAVAGGVTSYMEMPNTIPNTTNIQTLKEKFKLAESKSMANYSFYLGATNKNIDELIRANENDACGIKVFLGASTGNMIVDNQNVLERIFSECDSLIVVHSEDENIIKSNLIKYKEEFGDEIPTKYHSLIRSAEACYKATLNAIDLANKFNTRLHIAHLSTQEELEFLTKNQPLTDKRITSEVCVHHLYFDDSDYETYGTQIKCNPSIKEKSHKKALLQAILDDIVDLISSDHAPHTFEEKAQNYLGSPSGIPMIQHILPIMLEFHSQGKISLEKIVEKMCHGPAIAFGINKRGFIQEGFKADIALINQKSEYQVTKSNIYYKCNWSPFEGLSLGSRITHTFVNGNLVFENGNFINTFPGEKLVFSK